MKRLALTVLILMGSSAHALAAATPEEAQRLTTLFQAYLGAEPGVVTVAPLADSYRATIDVAPLLAKVKEPGFSASLSPIAWTLTPQGSGKWKVDQDQPLSFAFKVDGQVEMKGSMGSIKGTGIFDEALGTFASTSSEYTQFAFEQVMTENGQTSRVVYTIASLKAESTMTGTSDSADGTSRYTYTDLRETLSIPQGAGAPPVDIAIASPSGFQDGTVKGLKPKAMTELVAWLVARPSKERIIADQTGLKERLRAALPVFSHVSANGTINGLTVNSMIGQFALDKLDVTVDMNGVVADGLLREKFVFSGFKPPQGIVPPWAASLVPENFTIDFNVKDFDLAAPAAMIIDRLDLSKDPPLPNDMDTALQQALMPKGSVTIGLGPSEIIARIFDLKAEGSMTAGPIALPRARRW